MVYFDLGMWPSWCTPLRTSDHMQLVLACQTKGLESGSLILLLRTMQGSEVPAFGPDYLSPGSRAMLSSSDGSASSMLSAWSDVVCPAPCCLWVCREIEHVCLFNQHWC